MNAPDHTQPLRHLAKVVLHHGQPLRDLVLRARARRWTKTAKDKPAKEEAQP